MKFSLHNIVSELQLYVAGEEERVEHSHSHMQLAQHFFPSCICAAALPIIQLLEDLQVTEDGVSGITSMSVCIAHLEGFVCYVDITCLFIKIATCYDIYSYTTSIFSTEYFKNISSVYTLQ